MSAVSDAGPDPRSSLADHVRFHAAHRPTDTAYVIGDRALDWHGYDAASDRLARVLVGLDLAPDETVAVWLPDGTAIHIAFQATERAGRRALGIGARCGERELVHLLELSGARTLITAPTWGQDSTAHRVARLRERGLAIDHHIVVHDDGFEGDRIEVDGRPAPLAPAESLDGLGLAPDDLFLFNTTSGTTGLPKIVIHDQLRWFAFHRFAVDVGHLTRDDVFMSAVPAPFGFGLWTAHVTPSLLGVPCVVMPRFDAEAAVKAIAQHRVTVLAAVSTQFILMLEAGEIEEAGALALRCLFTGGEAVPEQRARAFEERTGASVLQFYGSNETGAVSATRPEDPPHKRLTTAGRPFAEMQLRLYDAEGNEITAGGKGQPGVRGPTLSRGYLGAPEAQAELIRPDGWMLLGDLVEVDEDGYLSVIGRTDDIIIRGGKNLSAAAIEEAVSTHPSVTLCAAIGIPDAIFGERAAAYVELADGADVIDLDAVKAHLEEKGISREIWPEVLIVMDALPQNAGGKVAKHVLRDDARKRIGSSLEGDDATRAQAASRGDRD